MTFILDSAHVMTTFPCFKNNLTSPDEGNQWLKTVSEVRELHGSRRAQTQKRFSFLRPPKKIKIDSVSKTKFAFSDHAEAKSIAKESTVSSPKQSPQMNGGGVDMVPKFAGTMSRANMKSCASRKGSLPLPRHQ